MSSPARLRADRKEFRFQVAGRAANRFYSKFDRERQAFAKALAWIRDEQQRSWYVTALLNRVMFIYFIQGSLLPSGDRSYLQRKLDATPSPKKNRFYHDFFIPLCFFG